MKPALYIFVTSALVVLSSAATYFFVSKSRQPDLSLPLVYQKIAQYQTDYAPLLVGTGYNLVFKGQIKALSGGYFAISKNGVDLAFNPDPNNKIHIPEFQEKIASTSTYYLLRAKDIRIGDTVEVAAAVDQKTGRLIPNIVTRIVE